MCGDCPGLCDGGRLTAEGGRWLVVVDLRADSDRGMRGENESELEEEAGVYLGTREESTVPAGRGGGGLDSCEALGEG
jgi:hypothetical protein